jgi:hypothetical protein
MTRQITYTLAALLLLATSLSASDGKWTPQQVLDLDPAWLKKQGLEIPPSRLWDPKRGTGLLAGTVNVGGCSGGFISADGLFITNHHCLFGMLQEHATPQNDIITNGYLARTRAGELSSKTTPMTIPRTFTDVTKDILAAVPAKATDAERYRAIERKSIAMVVECEKKPATRCRVAAHDGGVQYVLVDMLELQDVRLVYAPARAIGEYGGEIDNWMWPRHTGDFAIGRAYVGPNGASAKYAAANVPYKPEFFFPIARNGIKPGDFIMVLGYPGTTYRALTAGEMSERRDLFFTRRADLYAEWIRILEETAKGNSEGTIAVADTVKTLANRQKNAEGQLAGFTRGSILEKQRTNDEQVLAWAAKRADMKDAVAAYADLSKMIDEQRRTWERDFLLAQVQPTALSPSPLGPKAIVLGEVVARAAIERPKKDEDRDPLYMERNIERQRDRLEREQKKLFTAGDKAQLASFVMRALKLPAGQRIAAIDRLFGATSDYAAINRRVDELFAQTKLFDGAERSKMWKETEAQLRERHDPLVDLGLDIDRELRELSEREETWKGTVYRLRPVWRRAVIAHAGKPVAPDANSTLRVTFGHVKGYEPRDGVWYVPQTTLSGVLEKNTGEEPFNAPAKIVEAARAGRLGRWKDGKLNDVPVNFLGDSDTTGGNSGSPTVNGRGELVGVNFDRVWENVANDFGFNPDIARNVNVDVRYLLWILDEVENASELLKELGVAK